MVENNFTDGSERNDCTTGCLVMTWRQGSDRLFVSRGLDRKAMTLILPPISPPRVQEPANAGDADGSPVDCELHIQREAPFVPR